MLYFLGQMGESLPLLNVFRYLTFRTGGAAITALFLIFLFGPSVIQLLKVRQGKGQPIREDGPQSHLVNKKGKPTMGGLMILAGAVVSILLWADLSNVYVWAVLLVTGGFGLVGFYDDYLKVKHQSHAGFGGRQRLAIEPRSRWSRAFSSPPRPRSRSRRRSSSVHQGSGDQPGAAVLCVRRLCHRRRGQFGQSDRRSRWLAIVPVMIAAAVLA